jgi:hypothetical protein
MADTGVRLTGLDWLVVAAATVSLAVLITWMVQGRPRPNRSQPGPEPVVD